MGRSGYCDDGDDTWAVIRWRGAVSAAINGKRGQAMLRDLLAALDAMPVKELITNELVADGSYCTLGVLGAERDLPMATISPYDHEKLADSFGVARSLVQEIEFFNDEAGDYQESPSDRWRRMREWVASQIKDEACT